MSTNIQHHRAIVLKKLTIPQLVKDFPRILRNHIIYYRVHNSSSLVQLQGQINPVHILPSYFTLE